MATVYEDITTLIPNTTMQLRSVDGVPKNYTITPIEGYVIHDKGRDYTRRVAVTDEYGNIIHDQNGNIVYETISYRGYTGGTTSCGYSYDFATAQVELDCGIVTAYGNREFAAVLATSVPENQIFGGGTVTPPVEVMSNDDKNNNETV